jgi:hypothetical protein
MRQVTTDLAPYDRGPVVAATEVVLTQLAEAAPESPGQAG